MELRPIPGLPDYAADIDGMIWRVTKQRAGRQYLIPHRLAPHLSSWGYLLVNIYDRAVKRQRSIPAHRLVALAFHGGPKSPRLIVHHKDNNRQNNRPENLEWTTYRENNLAAWETRQAKYLTNDLSI